MTQEQTYRSLETVRLWVENGTGRTAWFTDGLPGVTGLGRDGVAGKRVDVGLGFPPSAVGAMGVRSRVLHGEDGVVVAGEDRDVRTDRRVRPVVTGHTSLTDSERVGLHTSYIDIEILQ